MGCPACGAALKSSPNIRNFLSPYRYGCTSVSRLGAHQTVRLVTRYSASPGQKLRIGNYVTKWSDRRVRVHALHNWDVTTKQARVIQQRLSARVVTEDRFGDIHYVAGVDVAFDKSRELAFAAVVIFELPKLTVVEQVSASSPIRFPYVPGFLSFREMPAICEALDRVRQTPDLIVCDGQGYAHPRRFGLACHLGLMTERPCIGVGKSRLLGCHRHVPNSRGHWVSLMDGEEEIGAVLRSRKDVKPIYVSIGHRVSLKSAIHYVKRCTTRYRLPETTRHADRLAGDSKNSPKEPE